mmetsp:Transcript_43904/g.125636  ORF Transcript_43904/g.125636 Transcript_43904/m.125636 type:complete len:248 (-) Transcript_43904:118-861(-)
MGCCRVLLPARGAATACAPGPPPRRPGPQRRHRGEDADGHAGAQQRRRRAGGLRRAVRLFGGLLGRVLRGGAIPRRPPAHHRLHGRAPPVSRGAGHGLHRRDHALQLARLPGRHRAKGWRRGRDGRHADTPRQRQGPALRLSGLVQPRGQSRGRGPNRAVGRYRALDHCARVALELCRGSAVRQRGHRQPPRGQPEQSHHALPPRLRCRQSEVGGARRRFPPGRACGLDHPLVSPAWRMRPRACVLE